MPCLLNSDPNYPRYPPCVQRQLYIFYGCVLVAWIALVTLLGLPQHGLLGLCILALPVAVFVLAICQIPRMAADLEHDLHKANFLSIGLIIALPLFTLLEKSYAGNKRQFSAVVLIAIVMTLLGLVYVWTGPTYVPLTRHFKSALQTMAASLLVFALYLYFASESGAAAATAACAKS